MALPSKRLADHLASYLASKMQPEGDGPFGFVRDHNKSLASGCTHGMGGVFAITPMCGTPQLKVMNNKKNGPSLILRHFLTFLLLTLIPLPSLITVTLFLLPHLPTLHPHRPPRPLLCTPSPHQVAQPLAWGLSFCALPLEWFRTPDLFSVGTLPGPSSPPLPWSAPLSCVVAQGCSDHNTRYTNTKYTQCSTHDSLAWAHYLANSSLHGPAA